VETYIKVGKSSSREDLKEIFSSPGVRNRAGSKGNCMTMRDFPEERKAWGRGGSGHEGMQNRNWAGNFARAGNPNCVSSTVLVILPFFQEQGARGGEKSHMIMG
jgi:hypothetical protein